jgi:hypothetical protein
LVQQDFDAAIHALENALEANHSISRKPPQFPVMLRKMWSGQEIQQWIEKNWN